MNVNDYIKTEVTITPEDIKNNFNVFYDALQIKGRELSIKNTPKLGVLLSLCTKETFLKDKFIDDFSTLIAEMSKRGASREELDVVVRFTGIVLNGVSVVVLRAVIDDYPTITKIFDKYYKKDSVNTYFDCVTAFKYLMEGKKVRLRNWRGNAYIYYDKSERVIMDDSHLIHSFSLMNTSDDAVWELFKEN